MWAPMVCSIGWIRNVIFGLGLAACAGCSSVRDRTPDCASDALYQRGVRALAETDSALGREDYEAASHAALGVVRQLEDAYIVHDLPIMDDTSLVLGAAESHQQAGDARGAGVMRRTALEGRLQIYQEFVCGRRR